MEAATFNVHVELPTGRRFALPADACWRVVDRDWPTFAAAERSARALFRRYGRPVDILQNRREGDEGGLVATVRADANGRVWTDLTWDGARLI